MSNLRYTTKPGFVLEVDERLSILDALSGKLTEAFEPIESLVYIVYAAREYPPPSFCTIYECFAAPSHFDAFKHAMLTYFSYPFVLCVNINGRLTFIHSHRPEAYIWTTPFCVESFKSYIEKQNGISSVSSEEQGGNKEKAEV